MARHNPHFTYKMKPMPTMQIAEQNERVYYQKAEDKRRNLNKLNYLKMGVQESTIKSHQTKQINLLF